MLSVTSLVVTTVVQRNNQKNLQREKVVKLMSKTRSQMKKRRRNQKDVATVAEVTKKRRREMRHMTEVMRSQDSATACAALMFVEDASVLVDALAQNAAERRTGMFQVMVYPLNMFTKQFRSISFSREVQQFFLYFSANIIREF